VSGAQSASADYERRVAAYLRDHGHPEAERTRAGADLSERFEFRPDRGDIKGVQGWTLELKSIAPRYGKKCPECGEPRGRFNLPAAMDQVSAARQVNGDPYGAVIRMRKQAPTGRHFLVVELEAGAAMMARLGKDGT
jgi:hypothetical protein